MKKLSLTLLVSCAFVNNISANLDLLELAKGVGKAAVGGAVAAGGYRAATLLEEHAGTNALIATAVVAVPVAACKVALPFLQQNHLARLGVKTSNDWQTVGLNTLVLGAAGWLARNQLSLTTSDFWKPVAKAAVGLSAVYAASELLAHASKPAPVQPAQ